MAGTGAVLLAAPLAAEAQQTGKAPRIGFLSEFPPSPPALQSFIDGLAERGYVLGKTIEMDFRGGYEHPEGLGDLAAELIKLGADVIVTAGNISTSAAKNATNKIPIVMILAVEPVDSGFVASLARPGGNITGLTSDVTVEIWGKRLELLKQVHPGIKRVVVLRNPTWGSQARYLADIGPAAKALGVAVDILEIHSIQDFDRVIATIQVNRSTGLMVPGDPVTFVRMTELVDFAQRSRMPVIYGSRAWVDSGGLLSYGPSVFDLLRRAAGYVDKILKGTKPSDLPVERPRRLELVINLKTAKALGLTIPQALLSRADEVIE